MYLIKVANLRILVRILLLVIVLKDTSCMPRVYMLGLGNPSEHCGLAGILIGEQSALRIVLLRISGIVGTPEAFLPQINAVHVIAWLESRRK